MNRLRNIRFPERFQGSLKKRQYFEGWYFKIVSSNQDSIFAIIPGIILNRKERTSHAFIQVLDGIQVKYYYLKYPLDTFSYSSSKFESWIENSYFSAEEVKLDIQNEDISIQGELKITDLTPLPKKLFRRLDLEHEIWQQSMKKNANAGELIQYSQESKADQMI